MELAQVNVALMRAPLSDPMMRQFVFAFDAVARLAADSPGFVWQHRTSSGHETISDGDGEQVVNLSVWQDYLSLHAFIYRTLHGRMLRRRARWFLPTPQPSTALWWVEDGTRPTIDEAVARLAHLRNHGPSPRAFSLLRQFDAEGHRLGSRKSVAQ